MRVGEEVACKQCGAKTTVPLEAETVAVEPEARPRASDPAPPARSKELERLLAIGKQVPAPAFRLYSLGAVVVATFCGSLIGGLLLTSRNFTALGDPDRARRCLWLGVWGTALLIGIVMVLPDDLPIPNSAFHSIPIAIVLPYVKKQQGVLLEAHKLLGGGFYTKWRAAGIGLICSVAIVAAIFAITLVTYPLVEKE